MNRIYFVIKPSGFEVAGFNELSEAEKYRYHLDKNNGAASRPSLIYALDIYDKAEDLIK